MKVSTNNKRNVYERRCSRRFSRKVASPQKYKIKRFILHSPKLIKHSKKIAPAKRKFKLKRFILHSPKLVKYSKHIAHSKNKQAKSYKKYGRSAATTEHSQKKSALLCINDVKKHSFCKSENNAFGSCDELLKPGTPKFDKSSKKYHHDANYLRRKSSRLTRLNYVSEEFSELKESSSRNHCDAKYSKGKNSRLTSSFNMSAELFESGSLKVKRNMNQRQPDVNYLEGNVRKTRSSSMSHESFRSNESSKQNSSKLNKSMNEYQCNTSCLKEKSSRQTRSNHASDESFVSVSDDVKCSQGKSSRLTRSGYASSELSELGSPKYQRSTNRYHCDGKYSKKESSRITRSNFASDDTFLNDVCKKSHFETSLNETIKDKNTGFQSSSFTSSKKGKKVKQSQLYDISCNNYYQCSTIGYGNINKPSSMSKYHNRSLIDNQSSNQLSKPIGKTRKINEYPSKVKNNSPSVALSEKHLVLNDNNDKRKDSKKFPKIDTLIPTQINVFGSKRKTFAGITYSEKSDRQLREKNREVKTHILKHRNTTQGFESHSTPLMSQSLNLRSRDGTLDSSAPKRSSRLDDLPGPTSRRRRGKTGPDKENLSYVKRSLRKSPRDKEPCISRSCKSRGNGPEEISMGRKGNKRVKTVKPISKKNHTKDRTQKGAKNRNKQKSSSVVQNDTVSDDFIQTISDDSGTYSASDSSRSTLIQTRIDDLSIPLDNSSFETPLPTKKKICHRPTYKTPQPKTPAKKRAVSNSIKSTKVSKGTKSSVPGKGTLKHKRAVINGIKERNEGYEDDLFDSKTFAFMKGAFQFDDESDSSSIATPKFDSILTPVVSKPVKKFKCKDVFSPTEFVKARKDAEVYLYRRNKKRKLDAADRSASDSASESLEILPERMQLNFDEALSKIAAIQKTASRKNEEESDEDAYFSDLSDN